MRSVLTASYDSETLKKELAKELRTTSSHLTLSPEENKQQVVVANETQLM